MPCDHRLGERPRTGRPALYCSGRCQRSAHRARLRQPAAARIEALDAHGRVLDAEVIGRPHDAAAWASALEAVTGALTGREARGQWAVSLEAPPAVGSVVSPEPPRRIAS